MRLLGLENMSFGESCAGGKHPCWSVVRTGEWVLGTSFSLRHT
jgi:hypothetical protein